MLAAHATAMKYIGLLESPMPRKIALMTLYAEMNGMPIKQTVRYATVPGTASAGVDIQTAIGSAIRASTAVSATETAIKSVTVLPMPPAARRLSLPPTACPMNTVAPMASPTIITVSMCITCEPIETAVVSATEPNCPMIYKSAMPYSVCSK